MISTKINTFFSVKDLINYVKEGNFLTYVLFWSSKGVNVANNCLSQFYPAYFAIDNIVYRSAEQYYMAEKARFFDDQASLQKILRCKSPLEAKKLGRKVKNFNNDQWTTHRFNVVVKGNTAKFRQSSKIKAYLESTRGKILVEASPHDHIWSIGLAEDHPDVQGPCKWQGENLLGFALMKVCNEIF